MLYRASSLLASPLLTLLLSVSSQLALSLFTSSLFAPFLPCGVAKSFEWRLVVLAASHFLRGVEEDAFGRHEAVDRLEELRERWPCVGKQRLDDLALWLVKKG